MTICRMQMRRRPWQLRTLPKRTLESSRKPVPFAARIKERRRGNQDVGSHRNVSTPFVGTIVMHYDCNEKNIMRTFMFILPEYMVSDGLDDQVMPSDAEFATMMKPLYERFTTVQGRAEVAREMDIPHKQCENDGASNRN